MRNILINSDDINEMEINNIDNYKLIINRNIDQVINKMEIDILVIDFIPNSLNFIVQVKYIKKMKLFIKIIVTINMIEESIIRLLYDNGVDYILVRPIDIKTLKIIVDKIFNETNIHYITMEKSVSNITKITKILNKLGMPANLKGYRYIKDALLLCLKDNDYYLHTTSKLYPKLAKSFQTKASCIEKAIRNAIELSWCRGDISEQDRIFGYTIDRNKGRPTNGEFFAQLINYLVIS